MRKTFILLLLASFFYSFSFASDIITLTNQKAFSGKVTKIKNCKVHFKANKQKYVIPASKILMVQFEDLENKIYKNYLKQIALNDNESCLRGTIDGNNHRKEGKHLVFGFLFGAFGVIGAALGDPIPDLSKAKVSKQNEKYYNYAYLQCYTKAAKKKNVRMSAIGWGTSVLLTLAFINSQR